MEVSNKNKKLIKIHSGARSLFLPDKLKTDLDIYYDDMTRSSMDIVIILDGCEGSGKSYTSWVLGQYYSWKGGHRFTPDNIHFNVKDYIESSEKADRYHVNILDESRQALGRRRALSKSNVLFTNWLSENRDKRQVHILILPAVHDLDSYIATWRMKFVMHHLLYHVPDNTAPSGYKLVRGYFKIFENNKNLQQVIYNKAKYGYYAYPKEFKYRRKIKYSTIFNKEEEKQYSEKKAEKRKVKYEEEAKIDKYKIRFQKLIKHCNKNKGMTQNEIHETTGLHKNYIRELIKEEISHST